MRFIRSMLVAGLVFAAGALACQSHHEEGVKSDLRSQWVTVAADPQMTTDAARYVLESDQLKDINASSTAVDGKVTGTKSDGTKVKVDIEKDGAMSKVSVTVGTIGDPTLGASIAKRIKDRVESR